MKHFNYFLLDPAAKNRINRTVIAAKLPENTGGGTSQYCALRSEGAQVTSGCGAVDVPMTSYGASDEHPMSTRSASAERRWKNRAWKYAAMIFAVLTLSIANIGMAWGESQTFAASDIISTSNGNVTKTKGNITIKGVGCGSKTQDRQMCKTGDVTTNKSAFQLSSSAGNAPDTKYIEISVPTGYKITNVTLEAVNGGSSSTGKISAFMWNGTYALDFDGKTEITLPGYAGTCGVTTSVSGISGNAYRTVRIYKQVKYTGSSLVTSGGTAYPSSANNANIHQVIVECEAAASDAYGIYIGKDNDNYSLENLTNTSGTTWSKTITLDAGSYYEFKVKKTPSAGDAVWYGNNGKITATTSPAWDFNTSDGNCKLYTTVAGSYTFSWDASNNKLTVTYPAGEHPTKRIYMACGSTWCNDSPKFFVHSWGVSDYNTQVQQNACGDYYADIIWYNDYFQFTRNASDATAYNNGSWTNYSENLTYNSSQTKWTCTGWSDGKGTFSSSAYSPDTYTVSAAVSTAGYGTVSAESVTGVACGTSISTSSNTLTVGATTVTATATESDAQYTYAFDGWTWTPAGSTVTSDVTATANFTRTLNSYTVTWKNGATTLETDASVNYGATPSYDGSTPTKDADALYTYAFSGWSPAIGTITGDATYSAQFTATPKTVAYGDATIYAYNDSKRVVSGTRKTAMETALAGSDGETGISGSLPLLHSVAGLTSVVLAGQCKSEVKAAFPWLGSYIKMKTASTTATITFNVASGYVGTATIYFSGYNKTATLTNGANSDAKTSDSKNPETEGSFTSKDIALVSGANTLTISGNNGYISRIDVALESSCTTPTIAWSTSPANGNVGGNMTISVTSNYPAGVTITSNNSNATLSGRTVDESTVSYTLNYAAAGGASITASVDGDGSTVCDETVNLDAVAITISKNTPTKYSFSVDKTVLCGEETATLTLEDSEDGVTYELREDSSTPIAETQKTGTGSALTWTGLGAGTYVVYAVETATYSERQMGSKITVTTGTTTSITTQPTNQEVTVDEEATLTVVAAGTNLSYQWKVSDTENGTYSDVASDGTSASYSVTPAAAGTKWYKCVVTGDCGEVTSDKVSIVAAAAVTYRVTYNAQGGTVSPAYEDVTTATLPTPTKDGYTFQGWYTSGGTLISGTYNPTADITLHALWREDECAGGGGGSTTLIDWTPSGLTKDTKSGTATPSGGTVAYSFDDPTSTTITGSDSKSYYKFGSSGNYTITLTPPSSFQAGDVVHVKATSKDNSATVGIKLKTKDADDAATGSVATSGDLVELTATLAVSDLDDGALKIYRKGTSDRYGQVWVTRAGGGGGECYYVTYNGNGADGGFTTDEASYPSGSNVTVKTNSFTKTGYTFAGWNTDPDGEDGTAYTAGGTISSIAGNMTLYAQWEEEVACSTDPTVMAGSNSSVTSTTATVSCASGISSLGTGGCTITSYGFVLGTSENPTLSNTVHEVGTSYASTGTSFSKVLTGLTASTTYYVRPYATNGYGTAYGTQTSFTTLVAGATPIVSWDLKVNANWVDVDGTSDNASITDPETSTSNITVTTANLANKTDKLELSSNGSRYVEFTFDVACGKKLTPDSIVMQVLNVGGKSGGKMTHKAELSDSYGHKISGTVQPSTDGSLTKLKVTNGDKVYFQGAVSLKVWAWNHDGTNGTAFRMGQDVDIYGAVGDQTTPTATITWTKQPAGGLSGTNETVTAVSSDGSAVTITSNNGSVATVAGSTVSYVGVGSTYLTASGTDACGNTMVSVNSDNFTVIGAYNLNYDANTGTGTMTGETGVHYAVVAENDFTAPSGKVFFGWNTAANGTGDSYQPGDAIELNANTTLYAQWGTALTATWSVTKVDSKLYRGGGGYSVTVYLNQADWDASGNKDDLDLTATEGVTLKNIVKSINGDGKAQVTADFDITTGVDADATLITFTLFVPAAGTYASAELTDDEGLEDCGERSVTVTWTPTSDDITTLTSKDNGVLTIGTGSNVFKIYAIRGNSGSGSDAAMAYSAGNGLEFNDNNYYKSGIETYVPTSSNDISDISFYVKTSNSGRNTIYGTHDTSIQSSNPLTTLTLTTDFAAYSTKSSTLWNSCSKNKYYGVGGRSGGSGTVYLQKVTVTFSSGGGVTPTLSWETDLSGGVNKEVGDADFTQTATQDKNSLGAITYSSNNTAVATVNATTGKVHIVGAAGEATITATLAASGCFEEATATYTINVVDNCIDEPGTITSRDLGCDGTEMTVSGHTELTGVKYQWYKVGSPDEAISGATSATYTATAAGEYYVIVTNSGTGHCAMASTNTVTVTAKAAATATKIVDSWYVKNGRRTPDVALVQSENAESFTVKSGSTTIWESAGSTKTGFGGCGFHMDENGIIYLNGTTAEDGSGNAPSGLTGDADVTLTITAIGCGGNESKDITIHCQASTTRKSIAFVVDGTKDGAFDADNESHSVNTALYKYLDNTASGGTGAFDLTARNIYATTDEKAIREHYSQFDAILITDDPGTKETPSGDYKTKGYVNAFGTMVDVRPILTMEAYVSALANWKTKGIAGEPTSPNPRQYALRLECKDHEIYKAGLPNPAPGTHVWDEVIGGETYRNVVLVDHNKSPYTGLADNEETAGNKSPALQGFDGTASGSLLGLGRISNGSLQAAIERQEEPAARLLVFSIQAKALPNALTEEGKIVIKNILTYLLKTNMEEVDDCSNYFTGKTNSDWNTPSNWSKTELPSSEAKVRILAECEIGEGTQVHVSQVDIVTGGTSSKLDGGTANGRLTISAGGSLIVGGKIRKAEAPHFGADDLMPMDDPSKLIINTGSTAQAALIFDNDDADTKATVNLYSLGRKDGDAYQFQYFASPMDYLPINPAFAGSGIYTYVWHENGGWERRGYYTELYAFEGVGITTKFNEAYHNYTMKGTLASTADKEIALTANDAGDNIIGNSWMAPIDIASLITAIGDDSNIEKAVYIYCTGNDKADGDDAVDANSTETAGQWLAIPIEAAGWEGWSGLKVIPAMQAFLIHVTGESSLTLNYDNLVRTTATDKLNEPLRAPGRRMAHQNEFMGIRMRVTDSQTHTDLYLFEGEQFSEDYDNGWEAKFVSGDGRSAQFYAMNGDEKMAVLATDELEGTPVGFTPGKESNYTISFFGDENGYYLNDIKLKNSIRISEGETYTFTYEEGDAANRFYISRTAINAPEVATGVENLDAVAPRVQKIIYNDKLYIIRGGRLYDATGKVVK